MPPAYIHYLELRGPQAEGLLAEQLALLCRLPGFLDAALLHSEAQDLWLLESRWHTQPPAQEWPAGAKAWAFAVRKFVAR